MRRLTALMFPMVLILAPTLARAQIRQAGSPSLDGKTVFVRVFLTPPAHGITAVFIQVGGDTAAVRSTDYAGAIELWLAPATYRLITPQPLEYRGREYTWSRPIEVRRGMGNVDLTLENADYDPPNAAAVPSSATAVGVAAKPGLVTPQGANTQHQILGSPKDGGLAFVLSFLIPGVGQMYAGETGKGIGMLVVDLAGSGIAIAGAESCGSYDGQCNTGLIAAGASIVLADWIYSMIDAPGAAHRHNAKLGYRTGSLELAPLLASAPGARVTVGVHLARR